MFLAALACPAARSQTDAPAKDPDATGPAFEVATIRLANRDDGRRWFGVRLDASGGYTTSATSLSWLVETAYTDRHDNSTVTVDRGAPKWISSDQFDIRAKIDDTYWQGRDKLTSAQQNDYEQKIVQRLLAERFHLKLRVEMRDTPVYALVQAKGGAHVKEVLAPIPAEGDAMEAQAKWMAENPGKAIPGGIICMENKCTGSAVKMSDAIGQIGASSRADHIVIDATGLTGYYDLAFTMPTERDEPAMQEVEADLGMRFEKRTIPIKTYIIESAEKPSIDGTETTQPASPAH